jgi:centromere protein J
MKGVSPTKDAIKEFSCDDTSDCGPLEESGIIDEEEETFELRLDEHPYKVERAETKVVEEQTTAEGKIHKRYSDGRREIIFQNGVRREIWEDGYSVVYFSNGDIKQTFPATNRRG